MIILKQETELRKFKPGEVNSKKIYILKGMEKLHERSENELRRIDFCKTRLISKKIALKYLSPCADLDKIEKRQTKFKELNYIQYGFFDRWAVEDAKNWEQYWKIKK